MRCGLAPLRSLERRRVFNSLLEGKGRRGLGPLLKRATMRGLAFPGAEEEEWG